MVPKTPIHSQHSRIVMIVIEMVTSQRFGYGEREEWRELMVFGSCKNGYNSLNSQVNA